MDIESVGHIGKDSTTTEAKKKALLNCITLFHPKLPAHMHDKVLAFGFLPGILFRGQNLLLCELLLLSDQISEGEGAEASEGAPSVEESQASDSIM